MADFVINMTGTAEVDDSILLEFERAFLIANAQQFIMDQFMSYKRDIGAKSIEIPRYAQLALATTPLSEKEDPDSVALVDSKIVLTPQEFGLPVTTTKLANLQTGGMADLAASRLVGINSGRTQDKLALLALDASTNVLFAGDATAIGNIDATDIMGASEINQAYNKLARQSVAGLPQVNGDYVMIAHDDVIHDIRDGAGAGTWQDVHKYVLPGEILRNEVGMFRGFRVVRDNHALLQLDAGAGVVDVYNSYFMGFNAFGKAVSEDVVMTLTGPFDKLGRFVNIGWRGTLNYKIVEQEALFVMQSASSVGVNV